MNTYQVRFIRSREDDETAHVVLEVQASTPEEALRIAREKAKGTDLRLSEYPFNSVEVKHYGKLTSCGQELP